MFIFYNQLSASKSQHNLQPLKISSAWHKSENVLKCHGEYEGKKTKFQNKIHKQRAILPENFNGKFTRKFIIMILMYFQIAFTEIYNSMCDGLLTVTYCVCEQRAASMKENILLHIIIINFQNKMFHLYVLLL